MKEYNKELDELISIITRSAVDLGHNRSIICCAKRDQFFAIGVDLEGKSFFPIKPNDLTAHPSVFFAKFARHLALSSEGEPLIIGVAYDADECMSGLEGIDEIFVAYKNTLYAEEGLTAQVLSALEKELEKQDISVALMTDLLDFLLDQEEKEEE